MRDNEYRCDCCGGTFQPKWTDEEARKEMQTNFPGLASKDSACVCDDCFRKIMASRQHRGFNPRVLKRRKAGDVGRLLQGRFGYLVLGTDDQLEIGEFVPHLVCQSRQDDEVSAVVTGETTYEDYEKQAVFAGFEETCTDCFKYYFKVELKPKPGQ